MTGWDVRQTVSRGDAESSSPRGSVFRRCVLCGGGIEVRGYNRPADRLLPEIGGQILGIEFDGCKLQTKLDADEKTKIKIL